MVCGVVAAPGGASTGPVSVLLPFLLQMLRSGEAHAVGDDSNDLVTACLVITGAMALSTRLAVAAVEALVAAVASVAGGRETKSKTVAAHTTDASPRLKHALAALVALCVFAARLPRGVGSHVSVHSQISVAV